MKSILLFVLGCLSFLSGFCKHVTGGEVIYQSISFDPASNTRSYQIVLRLFRDDNTVGGAALPTSVFLGVYNNDNGLRVFDYRQVGLSSTAGLQVLAAPRCLTNAPDLNYSAGYYSTTFTLPLNTSGYTISYQTCCRVDGIANTVDQTGSTYSATIPGSLFLAGGSDNSPRFQTGISIICFNKPFTLDFSAIDSDGDSLVYSFADAYGGGSATNANFVEPAGPPFASIPYSAPYTAQFPLGPLATINSATGIISGVAPGAGKYVVCVNVKSYRNGRFIEEHRKDFIITVAECDFASASLPLDYAYCDNLTVTFSNLNPSPLNLTFDWDFGDGTTSTEETPQHTYAAAGDYLVKLVVNRGTECADSATQNAHVYPGFYPAFDPVAARCKGLPIQFNDATTANFGVINYWHWDFGVPTLTNDTSAIKDPIYTYSTPGTYTVSLVVASSKGCRDTVDRAVEIVDKPDFHVPNDTLICIVDTLMLTATSNSITGGTITWSPDYMISDIHSFTPLVSPDVTTTYTAVFTDQFGCSNTASVKVNVAGAVSLSAAGDTTICRTDPVTLNIINTNAIYFEWTSSPPAPIDDPTVRNPVATPTADVTSFHVRASISAKCFADDEIVVRTVPYPVASATGNDPICYGDSSFLHASGGSIYSWTPITYLSNPNIADPVVIFPRVTTTYTVSVRDVLGCPKPVSASITVHVIRIFANAGPSDTSIVLDQPLQLQATGGTIYEWTPASYLNNPRIANPIATPPDNITYAVRVSNEIGCFANDTINVKVYFVPPDVYVPSAFTPGGDALNDLFRPIALGIRSLENFRVYNRFGELVYETKQLGAGWNGSYKGQPQNPGTYVWQVQATDYKGKQINRKGSVILIR